MKFTQRCVIENIIAKAKSYSIPGNFLLLQSSFPQQGIIKMPRQKPKERPLRKATQTVKQNSMLETIQRRLHYLQRQLAMKMQRNG